LLGALLLLSGCAGQSSYWQAQRQLERGEAAQGLAKLREASVQAPDNADFRRGYFAERERQVGTWIAEAEAALDTGDFAAARERFEKALQAEPRHARAIRGLDRLAQAERWWGALDAALAQAEKGQLAAAVAKTQQVLSEDPNHRRGRLLLRQLLRQQADQAGKDSGGSARLREAFQKPVSLTFNGASLQQVFEALRQASGLSFVLDREVRAELPVTLGVTQKTVDEVVQLILTTHQLERRILDGDTVFVYPAAGAKPAEFRDVVVRSFYLSHAEAAKVAMHLKALTRAREVVVDEKLNLLLVRDTQEGIRLAERLIATLDLPDAEVMLDVEVMEVSANRLMDLGVRWPDSLTASVVGKAGKEGQLTWDEFKTRSTELLRLTTNSALVSAQLRSQVGESNLLANPRVRVRNKQIARVLIGQKVPVITSTATANVGTSQSVNYLDVGLKLEIEPTISLDDEVSMKINLEVSNITQTIPLAGGSQAYVLGTRNTSTHLRVRDGETNILAGLIERNNTHANTGIPGLNQLPLLNRLFGAANDDQRRTEIVLLVTPRIVRNLEVPGVGQQEISTGPDGGPGSSGPRATGSSWDRPPIQNFGSPPPMPGQTGGVPR
jgi:general secretion pathway protein D